MGIIKALHQKANRSTPILRTTSSPVAYHPARMLLRAGLTPYSGKSNMPVSKALSKQPSERLSQLHSVVSAAPLPFQRQTVCAIVSLMAFSQNIGTDPAHI